MLKERQTKQDVIDSFDRDARLHGGYGYTTNVRLSSELATRRWHEALLALLDLRTVSLMWCRRRSNDDLAVRQGSPGEHSRHRSGRSRRRARTRSRGRACDNVRRR